MDDTAPLDPAALAEAMLGWTIPPACIAGVRENLVLLADRAARIRDKDAA